MINTELLDKLVSGNSFTPSDLETIYYAFWDKGIDFNVFCNLPIPYIVSIINTHDFIKKQEEKEMKKSQRKR